MAITFPEPGSTRLASSCPRRPEMPNMLQMLSFATVSMTIIATTTAARLWPYCAVNSEVCTIKPGPMDDAPVIKAAPIRAARILFCSGSSWLMFYSLSVPVFGISPALVSYRFAAGKARAAAKTVGKRSPAWPMKEPVTFGLVCAAQHQNGSEYERFPRLFSLLRTILSRKSIVPDW